MEAALVIPVWGAAVGVLAWSFVNPPSVGVWVVVGLLFALGGVLVGRATVRQPTKPLSSLALEPHDAQERVLREIIDNIPHRVFWKDRSLNYLGCNRAFAQDAGLASAELIVGLSDYDMVWSKEQSDFFREYDRAVMDKGEAILNIEEPILRADGLEGHLLTSKVPLHDASGEVVGMLGMYVDITERKRMEEDLRAAQAAAEQASHAKSVFLANTSHEVRTPLHGIIGMVDLVLDEPLSEEGRSRLVVARNSAKSLLGIINDVFDLTRLQAERLALDVEDFDLSSMLVELYHTLRPQAEARGLMYSVVVEGEVPKFFASDHIRLRQSITNLVGNAIKFTETGSVTLRVQVTTNDAQPALVFSVEDTGIGIPPEALPTLFEAFSQAHGVQSIRAGGAGLGLAISRRLVTMLGGSLTVESIVGRGTIFRIILPLPTTWESHAKIDHLSLDIRKVEWAQDELPPLDARVLLVEDNPVNQLVGESMLRALGIEVVVVSDGVEGLERLSTDSNFDIVLTDVHMPRMDGLEMTRVLRSQGWRRPIVAMSASVLRDEVASCIEAGCNIHLPKPVERAVLHDALSVLLRGADIDTAPAG